MKMSVWLIYIPPPLPQISSTFQRQRFTNNNMQEDHNKGQFFGEIAKKEINFALLFFKS